MIPETCASTTALGGSSSVKKVILTDDEPALTARMDLVMINLVSPVAEIL